MTGTEREPGDMVLRIWTPNSLFEGMVRTWYDMLLGFVLSGTHKIEVERAPPRHLRVD